MELRHLRHFQGVAEVLQFAREAELKSATAELRLQEEAA